jgi:hypothetical protein
MVKELAAASTIDDVLASHDRYLVACLKGCMLTNVSTLKTLSKLLTICDLFGNSKVVAGKGNGTLATAKTFDQNIAKFSEKFNVQMHTLLTTMTTVAATAPEQQMSNMVARLDFVSPVMPPTALNFPEIASSQFLQSISEWILSRRGCKVQRSHHSCTDAARGARTTARRSLRVCRPSTCR